MSLNVKIGECYGDLEREALVIGFQSDYVEVLERKFGESKVKNFFVCALDFDRLYPCLVVELQNNPDWPFRKY